MGALTVQYAICDGVAEEVVAEAGDAHACHPIYDAEGVEAAGAACADPCDAVQE